MKKEFIKVQAQVVNGECPTCHEITVLVGLSHDFYRCSLCGNDLKQHINGKISYMPVLNTSDKDTLLVSLVPDFFRCTLCGNDLKQHINGKISYMPVLNTSDKDNVLNIDD